MSFLRWLAAPLGPLYGAVVKARNAAFDAHPDRSVRVEARVVSIGNLSTGGTGKTPLVLFLADALENLGWTNAVVSRGYGGRRALDPLGVDPDSDPRQTGDEPLLMARRLGTRRVVVARMRVDGALRALALEPKPKVLLLDDGFQHRALHRDLDLLVLDGVRRWGNGRMLPLGDLREPQENARRAHALVVTRGSRAPRAEIEAWWARHGSGGPIFWIDFKVGSVRSWPGGLLQTLPWSTPPPLFAYCALGHPEAFFADLLVAGLPWVGTRILRDHQAVSPRRFLLMQEEARQRGATAIICTEKDAVKLTPIHAALCGLPLWVAQQEVEGGEALADWVSAFLDRLPPASA
jgi:tetraacyldisaccharide 4'-kinase